MAKRKIVVDRLRSECMWNLLEEATPAQIIERLQALQSEHQGRDVFFRLEDPYGDGGPELVLHERREENDREYNSRIAREQKARDKAREKRKAAAEAKKARELAEYERLKRKFEEA